MNALELEQKQVLGARTALKHLLSNDVPDGQPGHRIQDLLEPGFERKEYCFWQRIFQKLVLSGVVQKLGDTRLSYVIRDRPRAESALESDTVMVDLLWPETQLPVADVPDGDGADEVPRDPEVPTEAGLLLMLLEMMPKVVEGIDSLASRLDRIEALIASGRGPASQGFPPDNEGDHGDQPS